MFLGKSKNRSYSYGHLLVTTGYMWDYTCYKWGFKYLQLVKGHNCTSIVQSISVIRTLCPITFTFGYYVFLKGELIHLCVDLSNILELGTAAGSFILGTCMTHLTVYFWQLWEMSACRQHTLNINVYHAFTRPVNNSILTQTAVMSCK